MQSARFGATLILELCCFCCCCGCCCLNVIRVGAAAATAARHHIWSPGVSVASISQYLLVFYYKLFYESTLIKEYIHNIAYVHYSRHLNVVETF